jgi:1-acyl-sn-glycerol-3-phosphate acyltransferase
MSVKKKSKSSSFYKPRRGIIATIVFIVTYAFVRLFDILVARVRIVGKENLKGIKGGCFVISNHVLYLDPALIVRSVMPRRIFFTAMEETFDIPVIGSFIRCLGAIPVSDKMPGSIFIRNVRELLRDGKLIHFFPEGNLLHLSRRLQDFKQGVFYLSVLFNKPVLPMTIITKPRKIFGKELNKYLCRVEIVFGKPMNPSMFMSGVRDKKKAVRNMLVFARDDIQQRLDEMSA